MIEKASDAKRICPTKAELPADASRAGMVRAGKVFGFRYAGIQDYQNGVPAGNKTPGRCRSRNREIARGARRR